MKFTPDMVGKLKSYVYVYADPRTRKPFYIGKGVGNRAFVHLGQGYGSEKVARIRDIRRTGRKPKIDILRYGLTDREASLVEAAAIDLIGIPPLTNEQRGNHTNSFGRISSRDLITIMSAKPVRIRQSTMLITINKLYRSDMNARELYEATRGIWRVGPNREKVELAMGVFQGIVREVYRIKEWQTARKAGYRTRDASDFKVAHRWEFLGTVARDVNRLYVGKSVRRYLRAGNQNPIRYVNVR